MATIETKYKLGDKVYIREGSNSVYRCRRVSMMMVTNEGTRYNVSDNKDRPDWKEERYLYSRIEAHCLMLKRHKEELVAFFAEE